MRFLNFFLNERDTYWVACYVPNVGWTNFMAERPGTPPHYAPPTECPMAPMKRRQLHRNALDRDDPEVRQRIEDTRQQVDDFFASNTNNFDLKSRFITNARCDAAEPWQLGSQDAATPMMQGIIDLHHDIFFFLILILVFVSRMLVRALWHFNEQTNPIPQRIVHGTTIEIIRTIFPSVIPLFIAIPSFALLYSMDGVLVDPAITIKAIGHQWYRSAPLNEGDLSATKCTGGSRSIWLTGHLPFPSSRD
ncbi:hypothetical protein BS78_K120100 [Paspalum vaginatum]|nr:hypothetical protein BS78_K120100 [Paspalum vaginatum]